MHLPFPLAKPAVARGVSAIVWYEFAKVFCLADTGETVADSAKPVGYGACTYLFRNHSSRVPRLSRQATHRHRRAARQRSDYELAGNPADQQRG